jgi:hypothetical protein
MLRSYLPWKSNKIISSGVKHHKPINCISTVIVDGGHTCKVVMVCLKSGNYYVKVFKK